LKAGLSVAPVAKHSDWGSVYILLGIIIVWALAGITQQLPEAFSDDW